MINISIDEYLALVKGDFKLRPCVECENGILYIHGTIGELVTPTEYAKAMKDPEPAISMDKETCGTCFGLGKIVQFNEDY